MSEQEPEEAALDAVPTDYLSALQSVIADLDPEALPVNFIAIVEWLEPDGTYSMSTVHTPMPIWHLRGMLGMAEDVSGIPQLVSVEDYECGECEDDD